MSRKPQILISAFSKCGIDTHTIVDPVLLKEANERLPILFRIPDTNTTTVFVPAPDAEDDFEESPFEITDDRETTETAMVPTK